MVSFQWEENMIELIISASERYMNSKRLYLSEIQKNSRDGEYVVYGNKSGTVNVTFFFLPNYDIVIEKQDVMPLAIIKFLFKNKF